MNGSTDTGDAAAKAPHGIADVARSAGVSSRTLRHYDAVGLLPATAVGEGGLRRYDDRAIVRLQRILLLRGLGLGLPEIRRVLDGENDGEHDGEHDGQHAGEHDDVAALTAHLALLERERDRVARQLAAVRTTIGRIEDGAALDVRDAFDGFDRTSSRHEAAERGVADRGR